MDEDRLMENALKFLRCSLFSFVMKNFCQQRTNPFSSSKLLFILTLLFVSRSGLCTDPKWRRMNDDGNNIDQWSPTRYTKTEIDVSTPSQSEVPLNKFAYLHCKIRHRGNYEVTWIRRIDHKVLTVGIEKFTDDQRFQLSHRKDDIEPFEDFLLIIKYSQTNDSGVYECQVSTDPPLRFLINLKIIEFPQQNMADAPMSESSRRTGSGQENEATIEGKTVVEHGSEINLRCTVLIRSPVETQPIVQWYFNNTIISFGPGQPYVQRTNDSQSNYIVDELSVPCANQSYAGQYTCIAENSSQKSISVTVNSPPYMDAVYLPKQSRETGGRHEMGIKTNASSRRHSSLLVMVLFTFIHGHLITFSLVPT